MAESILIVDDEPDLASPLCFHLQQGGYSTRTAVDGAGAFAALEQGPAPDLILLDLMLPDIPGTEICRRIRSEERWMHIPVVIVSAKDEEIDRVVAFELGADDYVCKPFSVRELLLRIRAVLRRSSEPTRAVRSSEGGPLHLDLEAHRAFVEGSELDLTVLEFRLLATFVSRRGRVQTRETLLRDVWGMRGDVTTRTVDTHVQRLRRKLGMAAEWVETIRGVGYRFAEQAPRESHYATVAEDTPSMHSALRAEA